VKYNPRIMVREGKTVKESGWGLEVENLRCQHPTLITSLAGEWFLTYILRCR
jgi:hypothetical protein